MTDGAAPQRAVENIRRRLQTLDDDALDLILREARSHNGWTGQPVTDDELRALYELVKMGPTSGNCMPARFIFVRTAEARARLLPTLASGNVEKIETAPVTAIIGHDLAFWKHLPRLFPHKDMTKYYRDNAAFAETVAFRNGTLQGAYLIVAARALGLDTGPISGFDNEKVDAEFFGGTTIRSNFLCCLGHGDPSRLMARHPKFDFDEVCDIL